MPPSIINFHRAPNALSLSISFSLVCVALLGAEPILPFSAKLSDIKGVPLNGNYTITFRIYTEPAGGQPVWTEVQNPAPVTKGVLSVNLGSVSGFGALELLEGYWLGTAVGGDAEMTPRLQIPPQTKVPAGTIAPFAGDAANVPKSWILCNGQELDAGTYPRLYKAIGKAWGSSSQSTFRVPDLRGLFVRGVDDASANRDPDKDRRTALLPGGNSGPKVGSYQQDEFKSHTHKGAQQTHQNWVKSAGGDPLSEGFETGATGGNETRPKNAYVNYIIKS